MERACDECGVSLDPYSPETKTINVSGPILICVECYYAELGEEIAGMLPGSVAA
jgi:hypothetical protein